MNLQSYVQFIFALIFVIALILLLAWIAKKFGLVHITPHVAADKRRLKVLESIPVNVKHRLVLVQRDNQQHLLLLGPNSETVIETNLAEIEEGTKAS